LGVRAYRIRPRQGHGFSIGPALLQAKRQDHILIDANGLIQAAYYAAYVGDHLSFESIERFLSTQPRL
jgi:hypothetical protein